MLLDCFRERDPFVARWAIALIAARRVQQHGGVSHPPLDMMGGPHDLHLRPSLAGQGMKIQTGREYQRGLATRRGTSNDVPGQGVKSIV